MRTSRMKLSGTGVEKPNAVSTAPNEVKTCLNKKKLHYTTQITSSCNAISNFRIKFYLIIFEHAERGCSYLHSKHPSQPGHLHRRGTEALRQAAGSPALDRTSLSRLCGAGPVGGGGPAGESNSKREAEVWRAAPCRH